MTSLVQCSNPFLLSLLLDEVESLFDFATRITFGESSSIYEQSRSIDQPERPIASSPDFLTHFRITKSETVPFPTRILQHREMGL
jgi:hypothetical protein